MMDLRAAVDINQVQRVKQCWQRSQEFWQGYNQAIDGLPINLLADLEPATRPAYHLDGFLDAMIAQNIGISVYFLSTSEPPHSQRLCAWKAEGYSGAMGIGQQAVSLCLSARLTNEDVEGVIRAVEMSLDSEYK
jgi:dTDP-4-amino-4,6-dideoxygalactose transaminase